MLGEKCLGQPPLFLRTWLIKYEPIFKYVVNSGLVGLGYRKYDCFVHELQLYSSRQFDIMAQQGKYVEEISNTLNEFLKMFKAADQKETTDQKVAAHQEEAAHQKY